ncbi:MAG: VOC family protein [Actinomycetota bacterium]|nr:VOC family protein [Actinomycetota bacterium]
MADDRPVLNQINLVVRDIDAMIEFYRRLGLEIQPMPPPWDRHHRTFSTPDGLDLELDSLQSARQWNQGWPSDRTGPLIGFRVATREAVDATYADLTRAGYIGEQPPYDAFWGARYAVISDPDDNPVGLMSPIDPARRSAPPTPSTE